MTNTAAAAAAALDAARAARADAVAAYDRREGGLGAAYGAACAVADATRAYAAALAAAGADVGAIADALTAVGVPHRLPLAERLAALVEQGRITKERAIEVVGDPAAWVAYGEVCIESPDDGVGYSLWGHPVYW